MSSNERISRLQSLLERVQSRAGGGSRGNGVAHAAAAAAVSHAPPAIAPAPAELEEVHADAYLSAPPGEQHVSAPPQAAYASAPAEALSGYDGAGSDGDAELEISSETVDIDIDVDEPMPMESGAQPVAQQTMPPDDLEDEAEEQPMATQPSQRSIEPELEDVAAAAPLANEIEEPAPSSSRRPIASEEPAAEAYEEGSAPRHTPPPESGKQVAAPSVHPAGRVSAAPPSLEGHTLIGGWREPGLGGAQITHGFSSGASGVRVPAPVGMGTEPRVGDTQQPPARASGARFTADVVRPELTADANVASFKGAAAIARPATMGELLDLTLGL